MEDKIGRLEYWLLESVVLRQKSLNCLLNDIADMDSNEFIWNYDKVKPTKNPLEMAKAFNQLFHDEDLIARRYDRISGYWVNDSFFPGSGEIEQHLSRSAEPHCLEYYLTSQGAMRWEKLSNPDWSKYVEDHAQITKDKQLCRTLICLDRLRIGKEILDNDIHGYAARPGTQSWTKLHSWQATYWKEFAYAYRYKCISVSIEGAKNAPLIWWKRNWYSDPWEDPGESSSQFNYLSLSPSSSSTSEQPFL